MRECLPLYDEEFDKKEPYGLFDRISRKFNSSLVDNHGKCTYENLKFLCEEYRKADLDNHIVMSSQNGVGKSITSIGFAKYLLGEDFSFKENVIFAFDSFGVLIDKLSNMEDNVIVVDEANVFFNYKEHMTGKALALINAIEICRANRNIVISCVRDPRKLNNNYRNGKVHTVIHLLDRIINKGEDLSDYTKYKPYGLVFQGNWFFEEDDKFKLNYLIDITDEESLCARAESLQTFKGYFKANNILTSEDYKEYGKLKKRQQRFAIDLWKQHAKKSEKADYEKYVEMLNKEGEGINPDDIDQETLKL